MSRTVIRAIRRERARREVFSALGFAIVALLCYLLLLGSGAVPLSPAEVVETLTGGGSGLPCMRHLIASLRAAASGTPLIDKNGRRPRFSRV